VKTQRGRKPLSLVRFHCPRQQHPVPCVTVHTRPGAAGRL